MITLSSNIISGLIIGFICLVAGFLLCILLGFTEDDPYLNLSGEDTPSGFSYTISRKNPKETFPKPFLETKQTNSEKVRLIPVAAEQENDAESQYNLGALYYVGEGVEKNKSEAMRLFRKAAEQGLAKAQFLLGSLYYVGEAAGKEIEKNNSKAERWMLEAAEQGYVEAQFNLGILYSAGEGFETNSSKAEHWFLEAAKQRHVEAQFILGALYYADEEVEENKSKAAHWFREAAEQGHAEAQFNLGALYWGGEGVIANQYQAYTWAIIAKLNGYKGAKELSNNKVWDSLLTPEEIKSARQEAERMFNEIENRRIKEE